jgi:hypothetical protein
MAKVRSKSKKEEGAITSEKDLKKIFSAGYYASATFFNDLPPYWQVNIVQIGCKFIDDDGHNDDKARNVNIPGGGASATLNSTYNGCCRAYIVVMKARAADGQEWNFANSATVEDGYCGGNLKWHLIPEKNFAKGSAVETPRFKLIVE